MTDFLASPSMFGSGKRPLSSRFDHEDNYEGSGLHPHQPIDNFPSHKRPRFRHGLNFHEEENRQPGSSLSSSSSSSTSTGVFGRSLSLSASNFGAGDGHQSKRFRIRDGEFAADFSEHRHHDDHNSSSNMSSSSSSSGGGSGNNVDRNEHQATAAAAMSAMQMAFQRTLVEKDAEMASLRSGNEQLQGMLSQLRHERCAMDEENKILKRAVGIHDTRQKEIIRQNQGLQAVLSKAAEHIAMLEQQNVQLRMDLHLMSANKPFSGNGFDDEYRPPDVY